MKKNRTLFLTFCTLFVCIVGVFSQNTYVNQNATGANNGSSWTDAYTDLSNALNNTTTGEIWVAAGTYHPGQGSPDSSSSFSFSNAISIYGGFVGNETTLSERNFLTNQTILSGDINEDDITNDFDSNKSDNVQHVIYVESFLADPVVIDGFYIRGGHTSNNNDQVDFFWRGGGIFSYSTIEVRNCSFSGNFGRSGASVYLSPDSDGGDNSTFENCSFTNNYSSAQSAGIFANTIDNISITNCEFVENRTNRGVFYPFFCNGVTITDCNFESNQNEFVDGFGGVIFNWNSIGLTISNSSFTGNTGGNGGVLFHRGDEMPIDNQNLVIQNCEFDNNVATDFGGGALYVFSGSLTIDNCTFDDNIGTNGSQLFLTGANKDIQIFNSDFDGGIANFGGAHSCYGENSVYLLENNNYTSGTAETSGGALILGFKANVTIKGCNFGQNNANFGGAIYMQNDSTIADYSNCLFDGNAALSDGGAIYQAGGILGTYDNCQFSFNSAELSGGALNVVTFNDDEVTGSFDISNSIFNFNLAGTFGGAMNLIDINSNITSNLLTFNLTDGGGIGGAISCNTSDDNTAEVSLINNTLVDNSSPVGAGVSVSTGLVESFLTIFFQNNIFSNLGDNLDIDDNALPTIVSVGGNISTDNSGAAFWTSTNDENNISNIFFANPSNENYRLAQNSPAVDAGIAAGAPTLDIEGNPRIGNVDSGAYEFDPTTSIFTPQVDNNTLTILTNPVADLLNYELDNDAMGSLDLRIYNSNGQLMNQIAVEKNTTLLSETIHVKELIAGAYLLVVSYGNTVLTKKFVKF